MLHSSTWSGYISHHIHSSDNRGQLHASTQNVSETWLVQAFLLESRCNFFTCSKVASELLTTWHSSSVQLTSQNKKVLSLLISDNLHPKASSTLGTAVNEQWCSIFRQHTEVALHCILPSSPYPNLFVSSNHDWAPSVYSDNIFER
jgi:hypothetical protein